MRIERVRATRPIFERNLVDIYKRATEADKHAGLSWYERAHAIVVEWSEHYTLPIACVANVIAALSPQCSWERNLIVADEVLQGHTAMSLSYGPTRVNMAKACRIRADRATTLDGYFKDAPKVRSFAQNLAGDFESIVTVDTHAIEACWNEVAIGKRAQLTTLHYVEYASCYMRVARKLRLKPADFQAIIWHVWKRENPPTAKRSEIHMRKRRAA